jgi:hypothetical protein
MELGVGHFIVKVLGYYANFFEKKKEKSILFTYNLLK